MINLYIDENNIKIVVKDNGPGIAEEDQKAIFNRFMQSQKNKESSNEGSGIGLDLVSNLVKLHNGNITLNSTVGVGSEFIISIPRISASVSQKSYKSLSYDKVQQLEIEFSDIYL